MQCTNNRSRMIEKTTNHKLTFGAGRGERGRGTRGGGGDKVERRGERERGEGESEVAGRERGERGRGEREGNLSDTFHVPLYTFIYLHIPSNDSKYLYVPSYTFI